MKLIAGHGAGDGRRGPRPGRRYQVPNLGTSSRTAGDAGSRPWIIQRTGPVRRPGPRERHGRASRLRFSSPGRRKTSLPGAPAPYPGITLSDEGIKENARGPAVMIGSPDRRNACRCRARTGSSVYRVVRICRRERSCAAGTPVRVTGAVRSCQAIYDHAWSSACACFGRRASRAGARLGRRGESSKSWGCGATPSGPCKASGWSRPASRTTGWRATGAGDLRCADGPDLDCPSPV